MHDAKPYSIVYLPGTRLRVCCVLTGCFPRGCFAILAGCYASAIAIALLLLMSSSPCAAGQVVVASTSLTGAIAHAAGAQEVRVLTPADAKHPPEYDLKPTDLLKLEGADVVIYAGYERMVSKLVETSRNKKIAAIRVDTTLSPDNLIAQVRNVAGTLKTEREAGSWEKGFLQALGLLKNKLAPVAGKRAVVHWHAKPFAAWAGLSVVQVIPMGELTPRVIADAVAQKPDVVLDILHSSVAGTIATNAKCRYVQILNFPGAEKTASLEDIFAYNTAQLLKAF
jgi:zinc transport system substrate-binding protein